MLIGLANALGEKVKLILTTSMIPPLRTKCQILELIINGFFTSMVNKKKKT
jgi:hypothetical protein